MPDWGFLRKSWLRFRSFFITRNSLVRALVRARRKLLKSTDGLSEQQLSSTSGEGKWSIGEILHQVAITQNLVINRLLNPLINGYEPLEFDSLELVKPTWGRRFQSVLEDLDQALEDNIIFIRNHLKRLRRRGKLRHPFLGSLSPRGWLCFLYVYERMQAGQIYRLRRELGF